MRWRAQTTIGLFALGASRPGLADPPASVAMEVVGSATTPRATTAVAAFPDVEPSRPPAAKDPAAELLAENPYGAVLDALRIAANLYGGPDPLSENPYTVELRLANPYASAGYVSPRASPAGLDDDPYVGALLVVDPYRRGR